MNARTELLSQTFNPVLSIVVYKSMDNYYLESHDINNKGQVMNGKPLLQETIQEIVDVFFDERKNMASITGLIPENLLQFSYLPGGNYKMSWFRPAEQRILHFSKELKIPIGKSWVPPILYIADRKDLYVHALKTSGRPVEKTPLFFAPFFNVNNSGKVCLGNAQVKAPKDKTYSSLMKYWEDLFWLSEFTHVNDENKTKTQMQKLWRRLIQSKGRLKWAKLDELKRNSAINLKKIMQ